MDCGLMREFGSLVTERCSPPPKPGCNIPREAISPKNWPSACMSKCRTRSITLSSSAASRANSSPTSISILPAIRSAAAGNPSRPAAPSPPPPVDTSRLEISPDELKAAILLFYSLLDEQQRRLYAGLESFKLGHGGDRQLA